MMINPPDAVAFHNQLAESWEGRYLRGSFARRARFIDRVVLPVIPMGGVWLDAGCGTGTFSRMLAKRGHTVVGVDGSANMIDEARRLTDPAPSDLSFRHIETIERLPYSSFGFDGVICFSVLEYLERPLDALAELARVVRPGGTLVCSVPHEGSALRAGQRLWRSLRTAPTAFDYLKLSRFETTPSTLEKALALSGLTPLRTLGFDPIVPPALHRLLKPSLVYMIFNKAPEG